MDKKWNLQLNAAKSEHLTLRSKVPQKFSLEEEIIPTVSSVKDLGVTVSDDFGWGSYICKIKAKATILSNIILHTFSPSNTNLHIQLYKTYIRPILEYNTCTWSPHLQQDIQQVESVQRVFTRRLCQRGNIKFNSYNERLEVLKLETLESRRMKNDLIMVYKIVSKIVDIGFERFFEFSSLGGYNLRRHKLHLKYKFSPKTQIHQYFFSNRVVTAWNSLPENTVTSPNLSVFKRKLNLLTF